MRVQDPVARTVSAWRMVQRNMCHKGTTCSLPPFHQVVAGETARGGPRPDACLFNADVCPPAL